MAVGLSRIDKQLAEVKTFIVEQAKQHKKVAAFAFVDELVFTSQHILDAFDFQISALLDQISPLKGLDKSSELFDKDRALKTLTGAISPRIKFAGLDFDLMKPRAAISFVGDTLPFDGGLDLFGGASLVGGQSIVGGPKQLERLRPQDHPALEIRQIEHKCKRPFYGVKKQSTIPNLGNLEMHEIA